MSVRSDLHNASGWISLLALLNALAGFGLSASNALLSGSVFSAMFTIVALLSQHLALSLIVVAILWLGVLLAGSARLLRPAAVTLFSIYLIVVVVDTKVFGLYRFHLNAMVINLVFGGALQDNLAFSMRQWGLVALIVAVIVFLQAGAVALCTFLFPVASEFASATRRSRVMSRLSVGKVALAALLLILGTQLTYAWHDAHGNVAVTSQARYVPWFTPVTMKRALRRMGVDVKPGQGGVLAVQGGSGLHYPQRPLDCDAVERPVNILVVLVDALRFDMLDTRTMPHTEMFARGATRFNSHFSTGNSTRFGLFGLFYGLPASYWSAMLSEQRSAVLIDRLVQLNYSLYIEASAPLNSPEFDRTIFSRVRDQIHWAPSELGVAERDRHATDTLRAKIASHDRSKPFFGFLFLDAPHSYGLPKDYESPFQPMLDDVNYLSLGPDTDPERFLNRYRASVHYNDGLIASVLDDLRREDLLKDTVVIITSDHGQEFNDLGKNFWGHNSNYSDFQIKVPLVVHWPERSATVVTGITSHEDIVPTLMQEELGCRNAPSDYSTGHNIFDIAANSAAGDRVLMVESWSDRAIVHGDRIYQFSGFGAADVYDRHYNPQAGEAPAADVVGDVLQKMRAYLR